MKQWLVGKANQSEETLNENGHKYDDLPEELAEKMLELNKEDSFRKFFHKSRSWERIITTSAKPVIYY